MTADALAHAKRIVVKTGSALIAEAVTQPAQKIRRGTIGALAEALGREGPSAAPALIFYGPLAEISDAAVELIGTP